MNIIKTENNGLLFVNHKGKELKIENDDVYNAYIFSMSADFDRTFLITYQHYRLVENLLLMLKEIIGEYSLFESANESLNNDFWRANKNAVLFKSNITENALQIRLVDHGVEFKIIGGQIDDNSYTVAIDKYTEYERFIPAFNHFMRNTKKLSSEKILSRKRRRRYKK